MAAATAWTSPRGTFGSKAKERSSSAKGTSLSRLRTAFLQMGGAVDDLQVRYAPEIEQSRPIGVLVIPPHLEQRDAMIDLGLREQPITTKAATPVLKRLELSEIGARCVPQVPCRDAAGMPFAIAVGPGAP